MIIREDVGDLFNCQSQTIACPINVAGAMGKGLALEFRERVDGLYRWYQHHYPSPYGAERRANYLQVYPVPDGRQVLLFPTKVHWREKSTVEQIRENLRLLSENYEHWNIQSLALPALGCGEGGLAYDRDVKPLLWQILDPLPLPVEVLFRHQQTTRW
jgi:O-acetyl-ADP-ribose deacetylase (regulator of RNase III)